MFDETLDEAARFQDAFHSFLRLVAQIVERRLFTVVDALQLAQELLAPVIQRRPVEMVRFGDIRLSFGQLRGHFIDGGFGGLNDRLQFGGFGSSVVESAAELMGQSRGRFVERLDVVSWTVVIDEQALGAGRNAARVTVKSHGFRLVAYARPTAALVAEVGRVGVSQFGQRHQTVAFEAVHELVRQNARRTQQ